MEIIGSNVSLKIASGFLFALFRECEITPEVAAEKTEEVIRLAVDLLYPAEDSHREFREDWILKYCAYLRDTMDEMIEKTKNDRKNKK